MKNVPDMFVAAVTESRRSLEADDLLGPYGSRARLVHLAPGTTRTISTAGNEPGRARRIGLNLFPADEQKSTTGVAGEPLALVGILERVTQDASGSASLGRLDSDPGSELLVVERDGVVYIDVISPLHGLFEVCLHRADDQLYVVRELDEAKLPDCGVDDDRDETDPVSASDAELRARCPRRRRAGDRPRERGLRQFAAAGPSASRTPR